MQSIEQLCNDLRRRCEARYTSGAANDSGITVSITDLRRLLDAVDLKRARRRQPQTKEPTDDTTGLR